MKVQASVARCLRTPPYLARGKGVKVSVLLPLRRQLRPEHDCRWQLCFCEPITVVSHRDKATPLHVRRSCFGPVSRQRRVSGGAAGYRPRVRSAYFERVYAHSPRCREQSEYRGFARICKGGWADNGSGSTGHTFVAETGGVTRRFSTASRHEMKLTAATITVPPSTTNGSSPSPNTAAPRITAQTNCRNVTGCVTVSGAARNASVMV